MRLFQDSRGMRPVAGLLLLLAAVGAAACGSGKDEPPATAAPSASASPEGTRAPSATPTRGPATVFTPTPGVNVPAPAFVYVRAMCVATLGFADGVAKKLSTDESLMQDSSRLLPVFGPMVQDYADTIAGLRPPADWKADHDRFVGVMRDLVTKMRTGEVKTFGDFNGYFLSTGKVKPLNEEAFKKIDEIIGQTEECALVGFVFGGL